MAKAKKAAKKKAAKKKAAKRGPRLKPRRWAKPNLSPPQRRALDSKAVASKEARKLVAIPKSVFDSREIKEDLMRRATDVAAHQVAHTTFVFQASQDGERAEGARMYVPSMPGVAASYFDIRFGRKLGEGSFGEIYALKGELENMIVKVVSYRREFQTQKTPYSEWIVSVVSEAALLRLFSAAGVGPRVPDLSVSISTDQMTALFFMERAVGNLGEFFDDKAPRGQFRRYIPKIERQVRRVVTDTIRVGLICVDAKADNILTMSRRGKLKFVLSDFDANFCCTMATSMAREVLTEGYFEHFSDLLLSVGVEGRVPVVPGTVVEKEGSQRLQPQRCPPSKREHQDLAIVITLAMIGGSIGIFEREYKKAKAFMENPKNSSHPVHEIFADRWEWYKWTFNQDVYDALRSSFW